MNTIILRSWNDGAVLFSGTYTSVKACLEDAVAKDVPLDYLELADVDLAHANLDGARMNYARFTRCDLIDVNLSEASVIKAVFEECDLSNACLCDTVAVGARFDRSRMTDMDVHYADLRGVLVTCTDFLKVDFSNTAHMESSAFMARGVLCPMSRRPVFLRGLGLDMIMLDEHVLVGGIIILRRDQMQSREGVASIFMQNGLQPNPQALANLWDTVQKIAA